MGRRLRTTLDLLLPSSVNLEQTQQKPGNLIFEKNELVYVRDFRNNHPSWAKGVVVRRKGSVLYDVRVENQIWSRHKNQVRKRYKSALEEPATTDNPIALELLLDTFNLKPLPLATKEPSAIQTARRSSRIRKFTFPL